MGNCVNKSLPEFKALASEAGINSAILAAKIGVWQDKNNQVGVFPSLTELGIDENIYYQNRLNAKTRAKNKLVELNIIDKFNNIVEGQLGEFRKKGREWANHYIRKGILNPGEQLIVEEKGGKKVLFNMDILKKVDEANYQLEKQSKLPPNQELNNKLEAWAKKNNISVVAMEDVKERLLASGKYIEGAIGVADLTNQFIAIADDLADITTLPEEAAHFAIELMLDDVSVQKGLAMVSTTDTYNQVKEDYANIYTTEEQFRKEALGKILAQEIIDKNKEDDSNKSIRGFLNGIAVKFNRWIKSVFRKNTDSRTEIQKILAPLADSILKQEYLGDSNMLSGDPLYQVESLEKQEVADKVNEIIQNADFIKPSNSLGRIIENPSKATPANYYVNTLTGKVYVRVTNFIRDKKMPDNDLLDTSNLLGNKADVFIRDFFNDSLKELSEYGLSSNEALEKFVRQLDVLKTKMKNNGETVLSNDIVLYNDELGIAGTVDLITYDEKGMFRIYDMKTMRGNQLKSSYAGDSVSKYDTTRFGKSKRQSHQEQLSTYRLLLNNTHGVKASELYIIPIVLPQYAAGDTQVESLDLQPNIRVSILDKVKTAELDNSKTLGEFEHEPANITIDDTEENVNEKLRFLKNAVSALRSKRNKLKKGSKTKDELAKARKELAELEKKIALGEINAAITGILNIAISDMQGIQGNIIKTRKGEMGLSSYIVRRNQEFIELYNDIASTLLSELNLWIPSEFNAKIQTDIETFRAQLQQLGDVNLALIRRATVEYLDAGNRDIYGNVLDPNFDPKSIVKDTEKDAGWWRLITGSYGNSDSNILKIAMKMIKKTINSVKSFTISTGRTLINLEDDFKKAGFTNEDLVDRSNDGKLGAYLVSEYSNQKFQEALEKTRDEIAAKLEYDTFEEINKMSLSKVNQQYYSRTIAKFYAENSKQVSAEKVVNGKTITISEIVPSDKYLDTTFAKNMQNQTFARYYNALLDTKRKALAKQPAANNNKTALYLLPQIRRTFIERLSNKNNSFLTNMAEIARESVLIDKDDTQFGDLENVNSKSVPIFFNSRLDKDADISYNLASTYTHYAEMAENFKQMNEIAADMENLLTSIGKRQYLQKGIKTKQVPGVQSKEFRAVQDMLDNLVYGKERAALETKEISENAATKFLGIAGKRLSWTKVSQKFTSYIRTNNLALNFVTSLTGFIKGSVDSKIEDQIGLYTTNESKWWARNEFKYNFSKIVSNIGKARQSSKMHLILEQNDVVDITKTMTDSDKNRAARLLLDKDILFTNYRLADYFMKGNVTLAVYDNYRLVGNKFITKQHFKDLKENKGKDSKKIDEKWKTLRDKSLYNAFEVKNDKLELKSEFTEIVTNELMNVVKNRIVTINHIVDGTVAKEDKGALSRTILGDFVLMHRGWFLSGIDNRLKADGINYNTEEHEIGYYRAAGSFIKKIISDETMGLKVKFIPEIWKNLSPAERRGCKKTLLDIVWMQGLAVLGAMIQLAADDDKDDMSLQYIAYTMNRVNLEMQALMFPAETLDIMEEPVVGARVIKELANITEIFNFNETYERGMYKGKTHAGRWWNRRMPWKNLYELQFPEQKNRFIKSILNSGTYNIFKGDGFFGEEGFFSGISNIFSANADERRAYSEEEVENFLE